MTSTPQPVTSDSQSASSKLTGTSQRTKQTARYSGPPRGGGGWIPRQSQTNSGIGVGYDIQSPATYPNTNGAGCGRKKQTARYSGPPRGGKATLRKIDRNEPCVNGDDSATQAIANFIPYDESRFSFSETCSEC